MDLKEWVGRIGVNNSGCRITGRSAIGGERSAAFFRSTRLDTSNIHSFFPSSFHQTADVLASSFLGLTCPDLGPALSSPGTSPYRGFRGPFTDLLHVESKNYGVFTTNWGEVKSWRLDEQRVQSLSGSNQIRQKSAATCYPTESSSSLIAAVIVWAARPPIRGILEHGVPLGLMSYRHAKDPAGSVWCKSLSLHNSVVMLEDHLCLTVCNCGTFCAFLPGMAELASLVQRLEVAVSRLESVSGSGGSAGVSAGKSPTVVLTMFSVSSNQWSRRSLLLSGPFWWRSY